MGARGGWDESAARLHDVLLRACGAPVADHAAASTMSKNEAVANAN
jgi:hypothetical protein